jgi:putative ABC transport system substrate-binding protein
VLPTAATYLTSTVEQPHHPGLDRRRFLVTLLAGVLVGPLVAEGQAGKTYRIGWLAYGWTEGAEFTAPEFVQKLNELQQKFVIEFRGHPDEKRLPGLARELVQTGVDVIVANGTIAAQAAHSVTHTVPIVFLISGDPVAARLVESLGHPGGNVTGPSAASPEFAAKRLELFKEAVPRLARVAVLIGGTDFDVRLAREIEVASPAAGVRIQRFKASVAEDFDSVFAAIVRARVDGLLVVNRPQFVAARGRLAELALRARLPSMFEEWRFAEAGGLMAYGPSYPEIFRRAAAYVDKILKGANPGDLPVEQPSKFELVINLKTAKALGLTIPPSLLARADQVIE